LVRQDGFISNHSEAYEVLSTMSDWGTILKNIEPKHASREAPLF